MTKKNTSVPDMTFEEAQKEFERWVVEYKRWVVEYSGASDSLDPKKLVIPWPPEDEESRKERAARNIRQILERYPSLRESAPSELW